MKLFLLIGAALLACTAVMPVTQRPDPGDPMQDVRAADIAIDAAAMALRVEPSVSSREALTASINNCLNLRSQVGPVEIDRYIDCKPSLKGIA